MSDQGECRIVEIKSIYIEGAVDANVLLVRTALISNLQNCSSLHATHFCINRVHASPQIEGSMSAQSFPSRINVPQCPGQK
jgi:hypothetical protein